MGIREKLNDNPAITTGATAGIIVLALAFIVWQFVKDRPPKPPTQAYYTVDDGATWFADDINKIPPFDHDGKQAVRVHVFTCDGGKTKFISHLERYTKEAKAKLEQAAANTNGKAMPPQPMMLEEFTMTGLEVKKPGTGDKGWIKQIDPRSQSVTKLECPGGGTENIEPVMP